MSDVVLQMSRLNKPSHGWQRLVSLTLDCFRFKDADITINKYCVREIHKHRTTADCQILDYWKAM